MRWQELKGKHPKALLYTISALLPMTIMLVVWFSWVAILLGIKV